MISRSHVWFTVHDCRYPWDVFNVRQDSSYLAHKPISIGPLHKLGAYRCTLMQSGFGTTVLLVLIEPPSDHSVLKSQSSGSSQCGTKSDQILSRATRGEYLKPFIIANET